MFRRGVKPTSSGFGICRIRFDRQCSMWANIPFYLWQMSEREHAQLDQVLPTYRLNGAVKDEDGDVSRRCVVSQSLRNCKESCEIPGLKDQEGLGSSDRQTKPTPWRRQHVVSFLLLQVRPFHVYKFPSTQAVDKDGKCIGMRP